MSDSWSPAKDEPGLAHAYSKPSDLRTSTMKSDPGRPAARASPVGGGVEDSPAAALGTAARICCAAAIGGFVTSAAAPAAAPFRKPRRSNGDFLELATE